MKKLLYAGGAFVVIAGILLLAYKLLETPKTQLTQAKAVEAESSIVLKDVSQYMKEFPQETVFLVRAENDGNAEFLEHSLLAELSHEYEDSALPEIKTINLENKNLSVTRLKSLLGIKQAPALVILKGNGKSYDVVSAIEFQFENPPTTNELRKWFFDNKQWFGPYGAQ